LIVLIIVIFFFEEKCTRFFTLPLEYKLDRPKITA